MKKCFHTFLYNDHLLRLFLLLIVAHLAQFSWWILGLILFFLLKAKQRMLLLCFVLLFVVQKGQWVQVNKMSMTALEKVSVNLKDSNSFKGTIEKIYQNSYQVQTEWGRIQLISQESFHLDDEIEIVGSIEAFENSFSTYGFNSGSWAKVNRLIGRCFADKVTLVHEGKTLRHHFDVITSEKPWLRYSLFQIEQEQLNQNAMDLSMGFAYLGMEKCLFFILSPFLSKKNQKRGKFLLVLSLGFLFHFPFQLVRMGWVRLFALTSLTSSQQLGAIGLVMLLLYPERVFDFSLILPFNLRLFSHFKKSKFHHIFFLCCLQSLFFHEFNLIQILFYPFLLLIQGLNLLLCFLALTGLDFTVVTINLLSCISTLTKLSLFEFVGTIAAPSMLLILLLLGMKLQKTAFIALLVFLKCGWMFPFPSVSFINVGQGDSILIRHGFNQHNILIDTGKKSAYNNLESFLKAQGITTLDTVILTHQDEDHCGGLELLQENFKVKRIIDQNKTPHYDEESGLTFLNQADGSENHESLMVMTQIQGIRFLLMGDADIEAEEKLQDFVLTCDILKLGHHGSVTSSSTSFLDQVQPKLAINSSGVANRYNHPSPQVVMSLQKRKIPLLDTQAEGDIQFTFTPFFNFITTTRKKLVIIIKGDL